MDNFTWGFIFLATGIVLTIFILGVPLYIRAPKTQPTIIRLIGMTLSFGILATASIYLINQPYNPDFAKAVPAFAPIIVILAPVIFCCILLQGLFLRAIRKSAIDRKLLIIFMSLAAIFVIGAFGFRQLADSSAIPSDDQRVLEILYRGLLFSCLMLWCFFEAKNALKIKDNFILKLIQILSAIFFLQSIAWVIFLVIDYKLNESLTSQIGGVASLDLSIRIIRAGIFCTLEILLSIYWVQNYSLNAIEEREKQEKIQELLLEKDMLIEKLSNSSTLIESGALSAGLAHELNQFLGRIALNRDEVMQLISRPGLKLEDLKLPLDNILRANRSAANLIASLRKLFNRGEEDSALCIVDDLVRDVVMLYASRIQKSHIDITMHLQVGEKAYIWESLFRQVVANLLSNAIEALDGVIQRNKTIRIESSIDGNGDYCLIISDSGPGIDPQLEFKIFNLFASTKSSGTGIGLWLSRYIVERHKGSLTYRNLPDNAGVCFITTVPMGVKKLIRS